MSRIIKPKILKCTAQEILDSRGNPTVEATIVLDDGSVGVASSPSGASTGLFEAHEKRDSDPSRYNGKGVLKAVSNIKEIISPALCGLVSTDQYKIDSLMNCLDGTDNKSYLGANAILAVSLAVARASASFYGVALYKYLGGCSAYRLPVPMMNILNGGAHASNNIEIQEFMILPINAKCFSEALRIGSEIYHSLGSILKKGGYSTGVGDEGGFAPNLESDTAALDVICEAIEKAGYSTNDIKLAIDAASGEWYENGIYKMKKSQKEYSRDELIKNWKDMSEKYPIVSIEDGLDQQDFEGWREITSVLGDKIMLVGDDLFVTNTKRFHHGVLSGAANAVLVKPNQIGTLSETLELISAAKTAKYNFILSHRSGETEDTSIADISVAVASPFIKTGAPCRSERIAKYNRLLKIENALGGMAKYSYCR